ncbi:PHP domain-containing protein [Fusobacterium sp. PH5-44]|uniref:PHP domain-containing protein n=1 Tax=unclassified Fusobacterium TaxID=2648384 RepID=UPI003D1E5D96
MKIDLHIHTNWSDGTFSSREIIEEAYKKNMKVIAITDHDTIDGLKLGLEASKEYGIEFINGIEISCNIDRNEVHILGYFLNIEDSIFLEEIKYLQDERKRRNRKIIDKLEENGIVVDGEELKKYTTGNILGRMHIAKYLIDKKYTSTMLEAFTKYLGKDGLAYVEKEKFSPQKAVELIRKNGGLSSLAHPHLITSDENYLEELILNLKKNGLGAIECYYSSYGKSDRKCYNRLAKKYSLLATGGSDFHGDNRTGIEIGSGGIEYGQFLEIKSNYKSYLH